MEDCIDDIRTWMVHHRLFIQSSKTEVIIIGSRQQLINLSIDKLRVGDVNVSPVNTSAFFNYIPGGAIAPPGK